MRCDNLEDNNKYITTVIIGRLGRAILPEGAFCPSYCQVKAPYPSTLNDPVGRSLSWSDIGNLLGYRGFQGKNRYLYVNVYPHLLLHTYVKSSKVSLYNLPCQISQFKSRSFLPTKSSLLQGAPPFCCTVQLISQ